LNRITKLKRLKAKARDSASFRGHTLRRFLTTDYSVRLVAVSTCLHCNAFVSVNTSPRPNQTEIAGEAVALDCKNQIEKKAKNDRS
jgi:hypothetical protein